MVNSELKNCLCCDAVLEGTSRKKFCNSECRNNYNKQLKAVGTAQLDDVTAALTNNRKILKSLLGKMQTLTTTQEILLSKGFWFQYVTHLQQMNDGATCYFCYEYGYLQLSNGAYMIIKEQAETE